MNTTNAPAQALRLSTGELAALTAFADSPGARTTAAKLHILDLVESTDAPGLGLSALVARGLARLSGETVETVDQATVIARTIAAATAWVEIGLMSQDAADGALLAVSPDLTIFFGAADGLTYDVVPIAPTSPIGDTISGIVQSFLKDREPAAASIEIERDGRSHRVAVIRQSGGSWELRAADDGLTETPEDQGLSSAEILVRVSRFWNDAG